jgi:antitoxin ParD1/3/4
MTMNINLTPQLEQLIREKVSSGRYTSASEVVREALRLMEDTDRLRAMKLNQLRRDIREGLESGPATSWNVEEMKRDGRKLATRGAARSGQISAGHSPTSARRA